MRTRAFLLSLLASTAFSLGIRPNSIKNLVTFGDSYTDIVHVGDGGAAWPIYAARYANLSLYPFAQSGATCSNKITPRPFLSVMESQVPLWVEERKNGSVPVGAGKEGETLYSLWIGTNDLGANALLTGHGPPGGQASLVEVTGCMVDWVRVMYKNGARNFLFQNMIPLETTPLYAADSWPNRFWTGTRNMTEWSVFMRELTLSGNRITELLLEALAPTLPDAHIGLFDSHALFADMYSNPKLYLNGTAPLNVDGCVKKCVFEIGGTTETCVMANGTDVDSFLWFDELHPSEQADRIVAREIASVVKEGKNRWTRWLS